MLLARIAAIGCRGAAGAAGLVTHLRLRSARLGGNPGLQRCCQGRPEARCCGRRVARNCSQLALWPGGQGARLRRQSCPHGGCQGRWWVLGAREWAGRRGWRLVARCRAPADPGGGRMVEDSGQEAREPAGTPNLSPQHGQHSKQTAVCSPLGSLHRPTRPKCRRYSTLHSETLAPRPRNLQGYLPTPQALGTQHRQAHQLVHCTGEKHHVALPRDNGADSVRAAHR